MQSKGIKLCFWTTEGGGAIQLYTLLLSTIMGGMMLFSIYISYVHKSFILWIFLFYYMFGLRYVWLQLDEEEQIGRSSIPGKWTT